MFRRGHTPPERPDIDCAYLARLERHIGRAVLAELVADGTIELADRVCAMERHAAEGDSEALLRIVHDLAGMAGHLGLTRLSHTAAEMGRRVRGEAEADPAAAAAPVIAAGRDAEAALRSFEGTLAWSRPS